MKLFWICLFLCLSQVTLADCNGLSFFLADPTWSFNSNPAPLLQITISKKNNSSCDYFLTFSAGESGNYNNRLLFNSASYTFYTLPYQLYQAFPYANILKDFPIAISSNDVVVGAFSTGGGTSQTITYRPVLRILSAYPRVGNYADHVMVSIYEGSVTGAHSIHTTQVATYNYTVEKLVDLSTARHALDFGMLSVGLVKSFDVILKYNAGYSLMFSSANNGQMKNAAGNFFATYSMKVNGSLINLNSSSKNPIVVSSGSGTSPAEGLRLPISATITSVGQLAGFYRDVISITVTSME